MKNHRLIVFICLLLTGCVSKQNAFQDVAKIPPLNFDAAFTLNVNSIDTGVDNPFFMNENEQSLQEMWQEVAGGVVTNAQNPEYHFSITLLYTKSYIQRQKWSPKYYASAVFELKTLDRELKIVNTELFKVMGMWNDGIGSLKGPVDVSAFNYAKTTRQGIIKLGFLDILNHISSETFRNSGSNLHRAVHLRPDDHFEFSSFDVLYKMLIEDILPGDSKIYYNEHGASLIYLNFVMAEPFAAVNDIKSLIWPYIPEESTSTDELLKVVTKLGYDKNWPLFPKGLDAASIPYAFE